MRIALGTDHAGYHLKEAVKDHLESAGHEVIDFGAHNDERSDYPEFVVPAARAVARGEADCAIVFGGSGNGEQMAANKVRGIRCALTWSLDSARLAKQHNDANAISLGARLVSADDALQIVDAYLAATFEGGRHAKRIAQIQAVEEEEKG